jgi:hypothetical protein
MATVLVLVVVSATFFISSEYHVSAAGSWSKMGFDTTQLTALLSYVSYTHGEQI